MEGSNLFGAHDGVLITHCDQAVEPNVLTDMCGRSGPSILHYFSGRIQTLNLDEIPDNELRKGISASINLMENINRGTVAEVIVEMALGGRVTEGWGDWDVELDDGSRIEVKSTGSVQAWPQRRPSSVTWQIPKTQGWELGENGYAKNPVFERRSDFYVLAMHNGVRPDDTDE